MARSRQNLEPQRLAAKIFQNKDLELERLRWSVKKFPLGEVSCASLKLALSEILSKGCSSQKLGFFLWTAVEKQFALRAKRSRMIPASKVRHMITDFVRDAFGCGRILLADIFDNRCEIGCGFRGPANRHYDLRMRSICRPTSSCDTNLPPSRESSPFLHFSFEPFVAVHVARNQLPCTTWFVAFPASEAIRASLASSSGANEISVEPF